MFRNWNHRIGFLKTMSQISNSVFCPQNAESDIESDVTLNQDSATVVEAETVINTHNTSSQVEGEFIKS